MNSERRGRAFIDLAALGVNSPRSYAVSLLAIVLLPSATAVVLAFVGEGLGAVAQYLPIVVAGIVASGAVVWSHRRPALSLVAPDLRIDVRRLAIGVGVEVAIVGAQLMLLRLVSGAPLRFVPTQAWPLLALTLCLIPLQAASEEILFRGYLTQALGRLLSSRCAIAALVALAFGILHLTAYGPLTVAYFAVLSLIYSLVSLRDDRLELAIGGHAGMNACAFVLANSSLVAGAIGGEPSGVQFNAAALAALLVHGALFYGLTRLLVRFCCRPQTGSDLRPTQPLRDCSQLRNPLVSRSRNHP